MLSNARIAPGEVAVASPVATLELEVTMPRSLAGKARARGRRLEIETDDKPRYSPPTPPMGNMREGKLHRIVETVRDIGRAVLSLDREDQRAARPHDAKGGATQRRRKRASY